jgi:serine-type D-Ala-D-Ala endopeptidase (penicillin-binding protein 7)
MMMSTLVAFLAAATLRANPSPNAIPATLDEKPMQMIERAPIESPVRVKKDSYGIVTTAESAIVADVSSGAVLYGKRSNETRPIASLTKLVTAMVVIDTGLHPDDQLWIGDVAIETSASHPFEGGETITRGDGLKAMLVASANEAANAFGDAFPGGRQAFVAAMNEKARVLGLEKASFVDPSGISPKNVASASDVARIMRSALAYPEIREATKNSKLTITTKEGRKENLDSTNLLLASYLNKDAYQIALGKTGSLPEAGFCLGQVTTNPEGHQVITVVLGSKEHFARFEEVKGLTAWAFDVYQW